MSQPLKLLIVEDNPADVELALLELRAAGFEPDWQTVDTETAYLAQLNSGLDLVLSDFQMPFFSGLRALELLKQSGFEIPFILLSGTIGEEIAVAAIKNGATDYLMKDRLARLGAAVTHALAETRLRRERRQADELAQRQHAELRVLFDLMPAMIWFKDTQNRILRVNQRVAESVGKTVAEIEGKASSEIYPEEAARFYADDLKVIQTGVPVLGILETIHDRRGEKLWVQTDKVPVCDRGGAVVGLVVMAQDVTERKRAEQLLQLLGSAVLQSKESILITDAQLDLPGPHILFVNPAFTSMTGYTAEEVAGKTPRILQGPRTDKAVLKRLRENLEHAEAFEGETINYRKDGTEFNLEWQIAPILDASGATTHFVAIQRDVSERRRAEIATSRLAAIVESSDDAIIGKTLEGVVSSWNKGAERIFGYSDEEMIGSSIMRLVPADRQDEENQILEKVRHGKSVEHFETLRRTKDGRQINISVTVSPIKDTAGAITGMAKVARDITARKRAEEALRDSEERFSGAFEHAPIGVALLSIDGRWLQVNRALCRLLGYSEDELLTRTIEDLIDPRDIAVNQENVRRLGAGDIRSYEMENRYIHRDGQTITVFLSVSLVCDEQGRPSYFIAQLQDITGRRKAEIALADLSQQTARRERLLNTALSSMNDFAQIYDRDGRLLFANQSLLNLWGITAEAVVGKNFLDLKYPVELARKLQGQLEEVFETKKSIIDETAYTSPTGSSGYYEYIFSPVFAADGNVDLVVGSTRDVTARKLTEELLRAGEAKLAVAQRIAHLGSWELDLANPDVDANALRWSDEMFRIAGFEPGAIEVSNELFFRLVPREDHEPIRQAVASAIRERQTYSIIHRLIRADGEERIIKETAQIFMDDKSGRPSKIVGTAQDITERRRFEEQIRQSQKMDAIGTLAGGIAHDFNNILAAINGYTELARMSLTGNPAVREHLGAVLVAANRAAALVRQILTFSRQEALERKPIQLLPIVTETFDLLRATVPSTIEFELSLAADAPTVFADPTQIHQILMNLGTNAWHAMKDRPGRLRVKLEKFVVDAKLAATTQRLHPGIYARVSVSDSGCGMNETTLQRIFEPFFSTKPTGEGTGLGLAVVHGIIDSHQGAITVESQLGIGTAFRVYLPEYVSGVAVTAGEAETVPRGHGERILVVDDEELLARLGEKTLAALGYEVEFATQPSVALAMVRSEPQRFALVVADQTMPGMTGLQLATQLRQIRPDLPIILMTGNAASVNAERVEAAGVQQVLLKPATVQSLGIAVHTALLAELPH